jgi:hypothetical protein
MEESIIVRGLLLLFVSVSPSVAADAPRIPSIDDLLKIKTVVAAKSSPDGKRVASPFYMDGL